MDKRIVFILMIFFFVPQIVKGIDITDCTDITSSGTYTLTQDITPSSSNFKSKCINIQANNVVLDCQWHKIQGNDTEDYGIYIYRSSNQVTNITIKNCNVTDWDSANIYLERANNNTLKNIISLSSPNSGVYLKYSHNNTITNFTSNSNSENGFYIFYSNSNTIINSTANSNSGGFYVFSSHYNFISDSIAKFNNGNNGFYFPYSNYNTIINSTATSNSYYGFFFSGADSNTIINSTATSNTYEGFSLYYSDNNTIINSTSNSNSYGFRLDYSNSNNISNSVANSNSYDGFFLYSTNSNQIINSTTNSNNRGFYLYDSNYTIIINSNANSNSYGFYLSYSNSSTISNSTANSNTNGFNLDYSNSNVFFNITADSNNYGVHIYANSDYNIINSSVFQNNSEAGIYLDASSSYPEYNHIYNCLFNNSINIRIDSDISNPNYFNTTKQFGTRIYSDGNYIGGNYYTNSTGNGFSDTCTDSDQDGFCDSPYDVEHGDTSCSDTNHCDYLPLSDEYQSCTPITDCTDIIQPGNYCLTQDITPSSSNFKSKCINIQANNVVLDCQWHTIQGNDNADYGIYVYRSSNQVTNITIKNCNVTDWDGANIYLRNVNSNTLENIISLDSPDYGIYLRSSHSNTITNSTANSNTEGFYLYSSNSNQITNSTANSNSYYGFDLYRSNSNTITNSTAKENSYWDFYISASSATHCNNQIENLTGSGGRQIKYFNSSTTLHDETLAELVLCNADYSNITNVTIDASPTKKNNGVLALYTDYSNFTQIISSYNYFGFFLYYFDSNTITNSTANSNNWSGFFFSSSDSNQITNSTANSNFEGFYLEFSSNNQITNSTANSNNNYGFRLYDSSLTTITNSTAKDNDYGFYLDTSYNNTITNSTANSNNDGFYLFVSNSNTITNSTANSNSLNGFYIDASYNDTITNSTANNNDYGLYIFGNSDNNVINNSIFQNNSEAGLYLSSSGSNYPEYNHIYNCLFNNSGTYGNIRIDSDIFRPNYFNTTKQAGTRIYSAGNYIGGNYYTNSTGNGFSDTCTDSDQDGFCDSPYDVEHGDTDCSDTNHCDYLPLSDEYQSCTPITDCTDIIQPGNYCLTQDITPSSSNFKSYCINISANNVVLDCQWHKIQGDDNKDYGIYVYRSSNQVTNITIKNCNVTDWDEANIYLYNANSNTLTNITANSNSWNGIFLESSNSNTLTNITANNNTYNGILLVSSNSNTITNSTANNNGGDGFYLYSSNSNTLTNITANNNEEDGFYLDSSNSNALTNSTLSENLQYDFYIYVDSDSKCSNYLSNVTGSGGRLIEYYNYSVNIHDKTLPELILCNADNSNVTNITIEGSPTKKNNALFLIRTNGTNLTNINSSNNDCGIYLFSSNSNTLTNITANSNSWNGIFIRSSSNSNTLTNITANNNGENGIYLLYSNSNTISNTTANSNYWGIYLYSSNSNTLTNITANNNNYSLILDHSNSNILTNSTVNNNNYYGLVIYYSDSNIVNNSVFQNNINYGIYLDSAGQSGPNKIYNCLLDNTNNVYFEGTVYSNYWNTTKQAGMRIYGSGNYIGGNYYTNSTGNGFSDTCTDSDGDGFCDHPYDLYNDTWCEPGVNCSNNVDYLPLSNELTLLKIIWELPTPDNNTAINKQYVYLNTSIIDSYTTSAFFDWNYSLVGYWSFEYHNSSGIYDNSSYKNFGMFHGENFGEENLTQGRYGEGVSLDGVDDYIDFGNDSSLNITERITLETWINSLEEWKYTIPITLSSPTPADNFQIKIELTPQNFNYSHARSDGGDIRFYQPDGKKLSYWIEEWNVTGTSIIWVKVIDSGIQKIYMKYGNPNANSESSGIATFLFFDDFNDNYFNTSKWTIDENTSGTGTLEEINQRLELGQEEVSKAVSVNGTPFTVELTNDTGIVLEYKVWTRLIDNTGCRVPHPQSYVVDNETYKHISLEYEAWGGSVRLKDSNGTNVLMGTTCSQYNWIIANCKIRVDKNDYYGEWNETETEPGGLHFFNSTVNSSIFSGVNTVFVRLRLFQGGASSGCYQKVAFDNVRVRKYKSPEIKTEIGNEILRGISKGRAYGLWANSTTVIGRINNEEISAPISAGWNHIVLTYDKDAASNELKLYVNGALSSQKSYSLSISSTTSNLTIGYFNGSFDEVRIFNRVLSPEEINASYNNKMYRLCHNFTSLQDGTYWYTAWAIDSIGNLALSNRKVTIDTIPPLWRYQIAPDKVGRTDSITLSAQGFDETSLAWAWLETNETGKWENKTAYGSPMNMGNVKNMWTWSNFTWHNNSVPLNTVVGWRIHYYDSAGNVNSTPIKTFKVVLSYHISGKVLFWGNGTPISGANVVVKIYDGKKLITQASNVTDPYGNYKIIIYYGFEENKRYLANITVTKDSYHSYLQHYFRL